MFDDGIKYAKLSDGSLISVSNVLSYNNRNAEAKFILASDPQISKSEKNTDAPVTKERDYQEIKAETIKKPIKRND
ncbi:hypothetical protein EHQ47_19550 [Leptospira bourretii]|uniref:hypothetical protein n=1 Tax=Leptospira bourretii TaxID=2484962 RepID=UPI001090D441|nr:hypothetical protein [Leptospira bourretii]TGL17392.1 hypothetical protein EHQ47_19550 [Leptospira bourretii]